MARVRLTLLSALTISLCYYTGVSLADASTGAASHSHARVAQHAASKARAKKRAAARAARCRHYARKHPHTHCDRGHRASTTHHSGHGAVKHDHSSVKHDSRRSAPARAGACAGADEMPNSGNLELIRSATLCLINQERSAHGEQALQPNEDLQHAAQEHASAMAFGDYFEHVGPHGDTPLSRVRASGYLPNSQVGYVIGENIAWGTLSLATPRAIVDAWIASPPHLANILDNRFRDSAIGVSPHAPSQFSHGQAGAIYSQTFGVIISG